MSQQPIEANVVLTADNSQYDQSMSASAANTSQLGKQVDSLTGKLERLAKSAGRKLMGFAAADVATITAATVAYGAWEKQMSSLNVQAAVLTKNVEEQRRTFGGYATEVAGLRREFAMTTSEAAALTQTISRLTDSTAPANKLTESFAKLGAATGESSVALSNSMIQLQRTMGTPQRETDKFNNQLLVLSQRSNSSAQSILDFSQNIAPVGRLVNMTQTDIMGFSNAFIKAGQDGYRASNVFNRMVSDIAYATQTGSPDLAKYANLVGMTADQFKNLGGTDQILKIFDSINRQGPQAITTLNRMGYDGMQTVRTITAMAQSGGMAGEISAARNADQSSLDRGSTAALDTLAHKLSVIRSELAQTAEAFGSTFAGPAKVFLGTIELMSKAVRSLVDSPLGKMAAIVAEIAAPFVAVAGAVLMASRALATFAAASLLIRSAPVRGFMETRALSGESRAMMAATGFRPGVGTGRIPGGAQGAAIAERGSWTNRAFYNVGADAARLSGARIPVGPSMMSRVAGYGLYGAGGAARFLGNAAYTGGAMHIPGVAGTGGDTDVTRRWRMFNSPTVAGSFSKLYTAPRDAAATGLSRVAPNFMAGFRQSLVHGGMLASGTGFTTADGGLMSHEEARMTNDRFNQITDRQKASGSVGSTASRVAQAEADAAKTSKAAMAMADVERNAMNASRGLSAFGKGVGNMSMMMMATAGSAAKFGGGLAKNAYSMIGGNPLMLGAIGAYVGYQGLKSMTNDVGFERVSGAGFSNPYFQAGGITPPAPPSVSLPASTQLTLGQATDISDADAAAATSSNYKLQNTALKNVDDPRTAQAKLATTWGAMSSNPTSVNQAALDLVNKFGPGKAQEIINNLNSGAASDPFYLATDAAHPGQSGFWDKAMGNQSGSLTTTKMNDLFDIVDDRAAYVNSTKGDVASRQYSADAMDKTVQAFTGASGFDSSGETGINFKQAMYQHIFGVDISDSDAMIQWLDPNSDLKDFLKSSITSSGGAANAKTDQGSTNLKKMLQRYQLNTDLTGQEAVDALYNAIMHPKAVPSDKGGPDNKTLLSRATSGMFGQGGLLGNNSVDYALNSGAENPNARYQAVNTIVDVLRTKTGDNWGGMAHRLQNWSSIAGTDSSLGADQIAGAQQMLQQALAFKTPFMTRTQSFSAQSGMYQGVMSADLGANGEEARQQAKAQYQQQVMDQYSYFKQQLYQQREFNISRDRGEEDYNLQREYAQDDFDRQRNRAESDYQLMRRRAEHDFTRQMNRGQDDYQLNRTRQEQDFHHSVLMMTEQTAKQAANIYQRTPVQQTSSAGWLLYNAQDQLEKMRGQEQDLNKLRGMGMSDNAIQQLGLTDPSNAQQLARMVSDVAENPKLVQQFNEAVAKRLKAAGALVRDESSTDWQEFRRNYRLARSRAQDDFERQVARSREDFKRSLSQQDDDFQRSLDRQDHDFGLSMNRMATAYNTSMDRAAADLARSAQTIDGNFEEILNKSMTRLSGHAREQAKQVMAEFKNLKASTSPYAIDLMRSLSDIFGIKYKAPSMDAPGSGHAVQQAQGITNTGYGAQDNAAGGVIQGWTPGVDTHHFKSDTGHAVNLSGGEAIMVPEWTRAVGGEKAIKEMNRKARSGSFAKGGIFWPVPGHDTSTYPGHSGVDINRGSGWDDFRDPIRAAAGGKVSYVGSGHGYGDAIFVQTAGGLTNIYGHTDAQYVHAGQKVSAGQLLGLVGTTGNSSAPHLHFGVSPGLTFDAAMSFLNGSYTGGFGGNQSGFTGSTLSSILKKRYPAAEAAATGMQGVKPLHGGDISHIINALARAKYKQLKAGVGHKSEKGWGALPNDPGDGNLSNQELVKKAAYQFGWGDEWSSLNKLVSHESGFRNTAQNPSSSAYGMFQFLNSTWAGVGGHKTSDPWDQSILGMRYIKDRYGDPDKAWNFWQDHQWYGDGGVFTGPQTIGVGERGPEMVLPLNDRGADFIADIVRRSTVGNESKQGFVQGSMPVGSHNSYNYQIDRSTTFTGAITVQANDPSQFLSQLRQRERARALSQPALGGRRV